MNKYYQEMLNKYKECEMEKDISERSSLIEYTTHNRERF